MLSTCVADGIGVSLFGTDWSINPIVLRVEWWFDGKQLSSLKRMKSNRTSYSSCLQRVKTGNAIGFRQLLCATSFDTVELEITINYYVYSQSVNASFT